METLKAVWAFLDGKKSAVAAVAGVLLAWGQAKGWITGEDALYLSALLTVITGVAVGHKGAKARRPKG